MYEILLVLHNVLRWVVLGLAVYAIYNNYSGWKNERKFKAADKRANTLFIASLHSQLLIGLILYAGVSPMMEAIFADFGAAMKGKETRFWAIEHLIGMIVGIAIAQIGSIRSKKERSDTSKFKTAFAWFLIGTLIILLMIPFGIWNVERRLLPF